MDVKNWRDWEASSAVAFAVVGVWHESAYDSRLERELPYHLMQLEGKVHEPVKCVVAR